MGKTSRLWSAACIFLWVLAWTEPSLGQDDSAGQDDSTGPEVWGPLWEPAWEGGWFTQASPYTLDVSLGRLTAAAISEPSDLLTAQTQTRAEVYAMARVSLPWEAFLPKEDVKLPLQENSSSSDLRMSQLQVAEAQPTGEVRIKGEQEAKARSHKQSTDESAQGRQGTAALAVRERSSPPELDARSAFLGLVRAMVAQVKNAPGRRLADARLASLIRRSRTSGLVPELRLRGVYGFDQTTSLEDTTGLYPGDSTTRGGHDSLLEARLTFRLDRLVLGDAEGTLERQRAQIVEEEQKRIGLALGHLLKWKSATLRAADSTLLPEEQVEAIAEEEAALAHLHLLTGGWFRGRPTVKSLGLEAAMLSPVPSGPAANRRGVADEEEPPAAELEEDPALDLRN